MHRLLERLDNAASTLVPLLYLAGLALGTIVYFTDAHIGALLAVGVSLALAAEIHSFLAQRRVRALWALYTRRGLDEDAREQLARQLWVQGAILAGLVAFSAYNATAFVASTWQPAPGWLPAPLQIAVRGLIVPVLFLLTGFLSPLSTDAGAILASASREMLHHTIKTTVKQWRGRIRKARRRNLNLAPVAIALMLDAGDADGARRIEMIDAGLARAEAGAASREALALDAPRVASGLALDAPALAVGVFTPTAPDRGPDRGPTGGPDDGPSSPTGGPTGGNGGKRQGSRGSSRGGASSSTAGGVLRLVSDTPRRDSRRDSGMTRAQQEALWQRDTAQARELLAVEPVMSTRELARRLTVGRAYTCHPGRAATIRRALATETPDRQARASV